MIEFIGELSALLLSAVTVVLTLLIVLLGLKAAFWLMENL